MAQGPSSDGPLDSAVVVTTLPEGTRPWMAKVEVFLARPGEEMTPTGDPREVDDNLWTFLALRGLERHIRQLRRANPSFDEFMQGMEACAKVGG